MRLSEICEINPKAQVMNDTTSVSFVAMPDVSEEGEINVGTIRPYGEVRKGFTSFIEGDVLFAKITPCMENGKGAVAVGLVNGVGFGSTEFHVLRPNPDKVDRNWIYYLTAWPSFRKNAEKNMTGSAGQKRVPKSFLEKYELNVPSLDVQREQANALTQTRSVINLRKRQISALDDLIKARFVELFGDPKLNPYGYPVHLLSEYIEFLTSGSRGWAQYCVDDGSEWFITIKNVKDCHISTGNMQPVNAPDNAEARRTRVQEGDLLISITADLGRTGVVTKEIADHGAYINQHLTCIRLNQEAVDPLYVAYFMESSAGKEQFVSKNQSAVKAGLNFNSINSLRLLVPPKAVQQDFLRFVAQVDKSKLIVQKSLDETQMLFDSLMQQYFGGEENQ